MAMKVTPTTASMHFNLNKDDSFILQQRQQKLDLKPMKLKNLTLDGDSEGADLASLEPFELPPPAIQHKDCSERRLSTDLSSESSVLSEEYSFQSSGSSVKSSEEDSQEQNQSTPNQSVPFLLPPRADFGPNEDVLRPSLFRKGASYDVKQDGADFTHDFD